MKCKGVLLEGEWRGGEKRRRKERKGEEPGGKRYPYLLPPPNEQSPRFCYRNLEVSQHECEWN